MAREPLSASEPRLLLLGLEEMPPDAPFGAFGGHAPDARAAAQDGDGGPSGASDTAGAPAADSSTAPPPAAAAPDAGVRAQTAVATLLAERFRKSIAHADLLVCFTSNYALSEDAARSLRACKLFAPLQSVTIEPIKGRQRVSLAADLLRH